MAKASIYQLKITLAGIRPPIWRRVQLKDCSLAKLNNVVQAVMGWESYHLWSFNVAGEEYGEDSSGEMDMASARKRKLSQVVEQGVKKFQYVYDFGDNWEHEIEIEKAVEPERGVKYPRCVAGARHGPPEDCGGVWGYQNFLEAIRNPKHEEHAEMLEWIGGEFDPEEFDVELTNEELAGVR